MNTNFESCPYLHRPVAAIASAIISSFLADISAATINPVMPIIPVMIDQHIHRYFYRQSQSDTKSHYRTSKKDNQVSSIKRKIRLQFPKQKLYLPRLQICVSIRNFNYLRIQGIKTYTISHPQPSSKHIMTLSRNEVQDSTPRR